MSLIEDLTTLKTEAVERINATGADIESLRVSLLGKKGQLTALLKGMKDVLPAERKTVGEIGNDVRQTITAMLAQKKATEEAAKLNAQLTSETVDVTLPGSVHKV
ncbi:MAG: phenylalanine--tRNA ligase subunit alpha, partial [Leuconostoc gelidum]